MIKVTRNEKQLIVQSDFNGYLPSQAKKCGGKWSPDQRAWIYDIQAEPQVEQIYRNIYGQWDNVIEEEVSIKCECKEGYSVLCDSIQLHGRTIARAKGRDSGAILAEGIILLSGEFYSGGSMKNWRTCCSKDTIFRVLHVPKPIAEKLVNNSEWCDKIEIEENSIKIDKESLIKEREKLLLRIKEIDNLLMYERVI